MNNPFFYSDDNKRYHTWNYYLRHRYGHKVCKLPISGGFTCPNRDGRCGTGGCAFCSGAGSGEFAGSPSEPVLEQLRQQKEVMRRKWPDSRFLPCFQPFSGTYAPVERLRELYEAALAQEDAVGLCVATRPDCLPDDVCAYLEKLHARTDLYVELGLQTAHDQTAALLNRGHDTAAFLEGYRKLADRGIRVCVHIINGLPGETQEMMLETARFVAELHPFAVKIHLLHILRGTRLADWYAAGKFGLPSRESCIQTICDQLELLPPETVIQRLTGDGKQADLIAPLWSRKKFTILNDVDKELLRRNSMQGMRHTQ